MPEMRRREFVGACLGAALTSAAPSPSFESRAPAAAEADAAPFSISVMLWTVYRDLPFPQRLQKVSEAGYRAVELVGEYKNWTKDDFASGRRTKRESSAEGFEIVRAVANPHVKFLYDFFHEQIAEGNLIAKLEKNIDLVGLVHVADVPGRHEPGTGEINYSNIFRKLGDLGYSRFVAMEFVPKGEAASALRAAREMALKSGRPERKSSINTISPGRIHATA